MAVVDRWHKSRPSDDEPRCEHDKVPSAAHGTGDRWQVRWRDEQGKQRKQNFAQKGHADRFDAKQRSDVHHGTSVDVVAARMRVADYFEQWAETKLWRDGSANTARSMFRNHIEPVIGHLAIGQVRASHIRAVLARARATLAESSLSQLNTYMAMLFRAAVADRIIGTSPVETISTPAASREATVIPTVDQFHTIADTLADRVSAVAWVAAGCGLRIGEILGLEIDSINWLKRTITIRQQLVSPNSGAPYLGEPKTKTSARTVEIPDTVLTALAEHVRLHPVRSVEIVDRTDARKPRTREAQLVFTSAHGKPVRSSDWSKLWKPAREAAGLDKGTGVHALRHFYASALIHAGATVKQVQLALGHSTPTVTLNTYVSLWPTSEGHMRSIMDSALAQDQTASARSVP